MKNGALSKHSSHPQRERPGDQFSFVAALLHLRLCHAFIFVLAAAAAAALRWLLPTAAISLAGLAVIATTGALLASGAVTLLARTVRRRAHWHDRDTGLYGQLALAALDEPLRRKTHRRSQALTLLALKVHPILEYRRRSEHAAADELARATARHLRRVAAPDGFVFRVGSAQFLCLLPDRMREQTLRALRESMGYPCQIGFDAGGTELVVWPECRVSTLHAGEDVHDACRRTFRELGSRPSPAVARPVPDAPRGRPVLPAEGWDRQGNADVATIPMPLQASTRAPPRALVACRLPGGDSA